MNRCFLYASTFTHSQHSPCINAMLYPVPTCLSSLVLLPCLHDSASIPPVCFFPANSSPAHLTPSLTQASSASPSITLVVAHAAPNAQTPPNLNTHATLSSPGVPLGFCNA